MMETLPVQDANVLDAPEINWRLIVYPLLVVAVLLVGGFAFYYYQDSQRENSEAAARALTTQAATPEALVQVADKYPGTTGGLFALISAGGQWLDKKDYADAEKSYQRVVDASGTDPVLRDSATLGLAASYEAAGHADDAIKSYLTVAHRGKDSPYSPFAYSSAARLYAQQKDSTDERKTLTEEAHLDIDSKFVKQANLRLRELTAVPLDKSSPPAVNVAPAAAP